MATQQDNHATLDSYAQALLDLADGRGLTQQVGDDLQSIGRLIDTDPTLEKYLADPTVGHHQRSALLDRVFSGQASELLVAFLKVLSSKNRLGEIRGIAAAFQRLLNQRAGNVDVEVTVAHELDGGELENVRQQISHKLGKNAKITQKIDDTIIGGLIVKIGDSLIDGSVKTQLESMKRRLIAAV